MDKYVVKDVSKSTAFLLLHKETTKNMKVLLFTAEPPGAPLPDQEGGQGLPRHQQWLQLHWGELHAPGDKTKFDEPLKCSVLVTAAFPFFIEAIMKYLLENNKVRHLSFDRPGNVRPFQWLQHLHSCLGRRQTAGAPFSTSSSWTPGSLRSSPRARCWDKWTRYGDAPSVEDSPVDAAHVSVSCRPRRTRENFTSGRTRATSKMEPFILEVRFLFFLFLRNCQIRKEELVEGYFFIKEQRTQTR